eukprot:11223014-Lingulodinium_polyedra.AAC.1
MATVRNPWRKALAASGPVPRKVRHQRRRRCSRPMVEALLNSMPKSLATFFCRREPWRAEGGSFASKKNSPQ